MASNFTAYNDIIGSVNGNFLTLCFSTPPKINSDGIWDFVFGSSAKLRFSPLPLLEFQMLLIFSVILLLHGFLQLFGLPVFVSQMIVSLFSSPFSILYILFPYCSNIALESGFLLKFMSFSF